MFMKKVIIGAFIGLICVSILAYCIYDINRKNEYQEYFLDVLNGEQELKEYKNKVRTWKDDYVREHFVDNDTEFLLLSNVSSFNEMADSLYELFLGADEFTFFDDDVLESIPFYNEYGDYYTETDVTDERVYEKNNCYYIKYSDIKIENGQDYITKGHFARLIMEEEVPYETYQQRNEKSPYEYVGRYKEDGIWVYVYYNKIENSSIKIALKLGIVGVRSCRTLED